MQRLVLLIQKKTALFKKAHQKGYMHLNIFSMSYNL